MRKIYFLFALAPAAAIFAACGGDDSGVDGGNDSGGNDSTVTDSAADTGSDSSTTDAGKDSAADTGSDVAKITITCTKPGDCIDGGVADAAYPPDSGEVCCGTITTTGTSTCSFSSASTACSAPASCTTNFMLSCGADTVRLCAHDSECVEVGGTPLTTGNKCCTATAGDAGSFKLCANTTVAAASNGLINCN